MTGIVECPCLGDLLGGVPFECGRPAWPTEEILRTSKLEVSL